ncbi:MAG TPA: hypothetical protein VMR18_00040 [Candidatus Saccharimonadales bacterium]|jgi:hypothetical protein|nr:hypothetical protein [Candidatus Saccharimonadales bacterium]
MTNIEVVTWNHRNDIRELSNAVYQNEQPGFQVDGVETYHQLMYVLRALIQAAPRQIADQVRFNHATYVRNSIHSPEYKEGHIDFPYSGLAVQHNVSQIVPVVLATSNGPYYHPENALEIDPKRVHNIKRGETRPGRLTVHSEGNIEGFNLLPTAHQYDRSQTVGLNIWARYAHKPRSTQCDHRSRLDHFPLRWRVTALRTLAKASQFMDAA